MENYSLYKTVYLELILNIHGENLSKNKSSRNSYLIFNIVLLGFNVYRNVDNGII